MSPWDSGGSMPRCSLLLVCTWASVAWATQVVDATLLEIALTVPVATHGAAAESTTIAPRATFVTKQDSCSGRVCSWAWWTSDCRPENCPCGSQYYDGPKSSHCGKGLKCGRTGGEANRVDKCCVDFVASVWDNVCANQKLQPGAYCFVNGQCENNKCGRVDVDGTLQCCSSGSLVSGDAKDYCTAMNFPNGNKCAIDEQCDSGLCKSGVCAPGSAVNTKCDKNSQCEHDACGRVDADGTLKCCLSGKLVPGKWLDYCSDMNFTTGTACAIRQQCKTGICTKSKCASPTKVTNETCTDTDQCFGSACGRNNEDGEKQCCASGALVSGDIKDFCTDLPVGHSCERDSQCTNNKCGRANKDGDLQCCASGKFIEGETLDECQDVPDPKAYYWRVYDNDLHGGTEACCQTDDPDVMPSGSMWVAISPVMAVDGGCQNEAKRGGPIKQCKDIVPREYYWTRYISSSRSSKDCCKLSSVTEMPVGVDFVALGYPGFCETKLDAIPNCGNVQDRLYYWRVNANTGQCCTTTRPDFRPINSSWVPIENGNGFNCDVCDSTYQTTSNDQGNYTVVQAGCAPVASCSLTGYNCLALGCFCTTLSKNCMSDTHCVDTGWNSEITLVNQFDWAGERVCVPATGLNKALDFLLPIVYQLVAQCIIGAAFSLGTTCVAAALEIGSETASQLIDTIEVALSSTLPSAGTKVPSLSKLPDLIEAEKKTLDATAEELEMTVKVTENPTKLQKLNAKIQRLDEQAGELTKQGAKLAKVITDIKELGGMTADQLTAKVTTLIDQLTITGEIDHPLYSDGVGQLSELKTRLDVASELCRNAAVQKDITSAERGLLLEKEAKMMKASDDMWPSYRKAFKKDATEKAQEFDMCSLNGRVSYTRKILRDAYGSEDTPFDGYAAEYDYDKTNTELTVTRSYLGRVEEYKTKMVTTQCNVKYSRMTFKDMDKTSFKQLGIEVSHGDIMSDIQLKPVKGDDLHRVYVLPSQLNAAEYISPNQIAKRSIEYLDDPTGGPIGQLSCDPAVAQYILDNASNKLTGEKGIQNAFAMGIKNGDDEKGVISGIKLKNGYLTATKDANYEAFQEQVPNVRVTAMQDVPVTGVKNAKNLRSSTLIKTRVDEAPKVDLVYASASPVEGLYAGAGCEAKTEVGNALLFGQYVSALRVGILRGNAEVILMPLGGGVFENKFINIERAIKYAVKAVKPELEANNVKVRVLAFKGGKEELIAFPIVPA